MAQKHGHCCKVRGEYKSNERFSGKQYGALTRNAALGKTDRSEVISVYRNEPLTAYDANDALQRCGLLLKIEATSLAIIEPVGRVEPAPMVYDLASDEQKTSLPGSMPAI